MIKNVAGSDTGYVMNSQVRHTFDVLQELPEYTKNSGVSLALSGNGKILAVGNLWQISGKYQKAGKAEVMASGDLNHPVGMEVRMFSYNQDNNEFAQERVQSFYSRKSFER